MVPFLRPPRLAEAVLAALLPREERDVVVGDLREEYLERARDVRGWALLGWYLLQVVVVLWHRALHALNRRPGWGADAKVMLRRMARRPGLAIIVIAGVALGVGANAAVLSLADPVLRSSLPFPASERLGLVTYDFAGSETDDFGMALHDLEALRGAETLEAVVAVLDWREVNLRRGDTVLRLPASFVAPGYFELLGIEPVLGRVPEGGNTGLPPGRALVLISTELWQSAFGGAADIVGRHVTINGHQASVGAVLPGLDHDVRQRLGAPGAVYMRLAAAHDVLGVDLGAERGEGSLNALVRLAPGATFDDAAAEFQAISAGMELQDPTTNVGWSYDLEPLGSVFYADLRAPVGLVVVSALLVFLLVTLNLAGLVTVQSMGRGREVAVRRAMGAGRSALLRLAVHETLVLVFLGGCAGLWLAKLLIGILRVSPLLPLPTFAAPSLGARVLASTLLLLAVLATALIVASAAPLLRGPPREVRAGGGTSGSPRAAERHRTLLVGAQVALAFAVLMSAGLMVRSLQTLQGTGHGFDTRGLLTARVELRGERYQSAGPRIAAARRLVEGAVTVPGVVDAFLWSPNLIGEGLWVDLVTREGRWDIYAAERLETSRHHILPATLSRAGIRPTRGRDFTSSDDGSSHRVAMVSESLAQHLWPGEDPLGQLIESKPGGRLVAREVVGVVEDVRHRSRVDRPFGPQLDVYYPYLQWPDRHLSVAVRLAPGADLSVVATGLRAVMIGIEPDLPLYDIATMAERIVEEEARSRLTAALVGVYGLLAAALAGLGIHGVLSHAVRARIPEIGVRMALGARPLRLIGRMAAGILATTLLGAAAGGLMAFLGAGMAGPALYGVRPWDSGALIGATGLLGLVTCLAVLPAVSRVLRVDPASVLRRE